MNWNPEVRKLKVWQDFDENGKNGWHIIGTEAGKPVAVTCGIGRRKDAKLFAAAPELLDESYALIFTLSKMQIHPSHYAGLLAAVKKATGAV